jgi:hypothetical protein
MISSNKIPIKIIYVLVFFSVGVSGVFAQSKEKTSRVFLLDLKTLQENKLKISNAKTLEAETKSAFERLERDAQKALKIEIPSITTKSAIPPSGDKRDYMSQAPYFWKNPNTKDGFPYIRRDGERNPEIKKIPDHDLLDKLIETVETLSIAYYLTGKEEYANRAAEILRLWFAGEKTRMNPNLEYAQAIPGLNTGRGIGIIETRNLTSVVDAIGLIENSKAWTNEDRKNLESWFEKYLNWLLTSKNGREEAAAKNNHGTFYDIQIASFALFVGKKDLAKEVLEAAKQKRIALQILPNGEQPLELERTKSWDYSVMNLDGLVSLAVLGESADVDLWNFETKDDRGIRKAIEFLYQFKENEKDWKHKQIDSLKIEKLYPPMRRAGRIYKDEKFAKMLGEIPPPLDAKNILSR